MTDVPTKLRVSAEQLRDAFDAGPGIAAADRLVAAWQQVCAADPDAAHRYELGNAHLDRYELTEDTSDVLAAVEQYEAATRTDSPDASCLNNLGLALRLAYLETDDDMLLDRSVEALCHAADIADDEDRPAVVDNLERSLDLLDFLDRDRPRLDRAVEVRWRLALADAPTPADLVRRHAALGAALYRRWEVTGEPGDLDQAATAYAPVERHLRHSQLPEAQFQPLANDLGVHHYYRYRALGDRTDLNAAITWSRRAASAGDQRTRANLGRALRVHHDVAGDPAALDEAIALLADVPVEVEVPLDLANALLTRFDERGDLADLTTAVDLFTETARRLPTSHPNHAAAHNDLANALRTRFTHIRDAADLARARAALETALDSIEATAPDRYLYLDNLANTMVDEFTTSGDTRWLTEASRLFDAALASPGAAAEEHRRVLGNRASVHWYLWEAKGERADLERALAIFEEVAAGTPPGESGRAVRFNNLAVALIAARPDPLEPRIATRIREAFTQATQGDDVLWAVRAGRQWGRWATARESWAEAAQAYGRAQDAMGHLFLLQNERRDRERWLREAAGISVEAGYADRAATGPRATVARLETGRGLLLSQAMSAPESEMARLTRAGHDDLVRRYRQAAIVLEVRERAAERSAPLNR